ncbi:SpoIID/LytB domain-containing protein [Cohnella caldifontis]|uniref:SpoIID/LytB domain-containing protein n=1 Tax=Cohnella caldifontis TaxID=3027471 RepID=UPI0023ED88A2|nr:SpoIID/LytB domain-containing protein [Cohnella sp. YIM B05605]
MTIPNRKRFPFRAAAAALLAVFIAAGSAPAPSFAAVDVPDRIRVALFLNLPSKNFTSLTPIATLQSAGGLRIGWRNPNQTVSIGTAAPNQPTRFAMDGYRALVLETGDLSGALAVQKILQASTNAVFVIKLSKGGKPVYQVSEGVYATPAAASAALAKWRPIVAASGIPASANPKVAGPWAAEAGPYPGPAEAAAAAEQIGNAGLDAFVAVKAENGAPAYYVRIGQEADAAGATAVQKTASAAGALNVKLPQLDQPYAVIRNDVTLAGSAGAAIPLYAFPASAGVVLRADPAGDGAIQLTERGNRSYRGSLEVSEFGGALAVVNDVDFEQYLYSVVGAEVGSGWPAEAQKAQAVAARSYALSLGNGFQIASVVDTTLSQAYFGVGSENPNSTAGVIATKGEVLTYDGKPINAVFSSNAGGVTADSKTEAWGNETPYLSSAKTSPDDGPQEGLPDWYDVALLSGQRGYIRADLLADAGTNEAGIKTMSVTADGTALRVRPKVETAAEPLARLSAGTLVVPLKKVPENTAYSWVEDPFTPDELLASLNKYLKIPGPLRTLEVSGRGPSGRVTQMTVNGTPYALKSPDSWRSALGGVRSTLLTVEETARMTVLGSAGATRELPRDGGSAMQAIGADGAAGTPDSGNLFVMDASGQVRVATPQPSFILSVKGYGHGLGMSQYGAKKLAEQGNDYRYILQYYYQNAIIEKDAGG